VTQKLRYKKDIVKTKVIKKARSIAKVYYSASKKTKKLLKDTSTALLSIAKEQVRQAGSAVDETADLVSGSVARRYRKLNDTGKKILEQVEAKLDGEKITGRIVSYYQVRSMDNIKKIHKKCCLSNKSGKSSNNKEYYSTPPNRFYTLNEEITLRFYQTPKALFNNPKYKGLSLGPKLMYSILRDRLDLSIRNNWKDEKGYIYLIFGIEDLASLLEMDRKAVIRYKKLLSDHGLIIDKRLGQGKPNIIYVLKPELENIQKSQKRTSRSPELVPLEVPNKDTNDTDFSETDLNNVKEIDEGRVVDNSGDEARVKNIKNKEDIDEIRRKIKASLNGDDRDILREIKNIEKDKELPEEGENDPGESYSGDSKILDHYGFNRRPEEKELLANEIADVLEDDHSLGAFRTIVDEIPEQQIRIFLSIIKDTQITGRIKNNRGAMFISLAKAYTGKNNINLNFK